MAMHIAKNYPLAKLVLWDSQEITNKKTANIIKDLGVSVASYTVDVADRLAVEQMAARVFIFFNESCHFTRNCWCQVEKEVGQVSMLINNAGITGIGSILEQSPELIEKTIQVNLIAHFWTLRSFLPGMIERNHGHIVTICSLAAFGRMQHLKNINNKLYSFFILY
jgi:all-trans-retinol dehydrogenase (NAD+)